jgi:heavy metal translocating P-type ATPase
MSLVTSIPGSFSSTIALASIPAAQKPVRSAKTSATHAPRRSRAKVKAAALSDLRISFPEAGRIVFFSEALFSDPRSELATDFFARAFRAPEVYQVEIDGAARKAEISFRTQDTPDDASGDGSSRSISLNSAIRKISRLLAGDKPSSDSSEPAFFPSHLIESEENVVRLCRHGRKLSSWAIKHQIEGRIRFENPVLFRKRELCEAIERELMNAFGVDRYSTNEITSSVLVYYDPRHIQAGQLIDILDEVLRASKELAVSPIDLDLALCTVSVGLAATSRFLVPALTPLSAALFFYSTIPSFKNAYNVVVNEKRLGVDVLDAIVVVACLASGQIFAGSVLAWSLSVARKLVQKTEDHSKKMLLNVFGKQPRFVWLQIDGGEVETPLEKLQVKDIIVVHTGETVPVDGEVVDGMAMIDQHALTGESAPAEKLKGDKVFASTIVIAGKIYVSVTSAGEETTSSKLARILNDTAGYKLRSQSQGEELADKAVVPTLALGALGLVTGGVNGAIAIVNCDLGTGIRVAAPIGMLTSLTLCAQHGILVKDGRALELMRKVDTFLFDKTGTLTRERPEVGRILTYGGHSEEQILQWAAAAENKFSHPIANAILDKFKSLGLPMAETDDSKYQVGYGITVGIDGHTVRVGSARFMQHEGIHLPDILEREMENVHADGHSLIMVGVDDALGGAIEIRAANRPEAEEVIVGLRARGAKHLAIISGDHDLPTRNLAEKLGMDRYFAEVLPQDKAKYVELLQSEGRTVCFVGDGINDSIALKKANVSISLRGASSIATDTAQVVFMEDSLAKVLQLQDISRDLQRNINWSWGLIVVPNMICIGGAFFLGFGVMHSMVFNQLGGLLALGNGLLPLRKVAAAQAEKDRLALHPGP